MPKEPAARFSDQHRCLIEAHGVGLILAPCEPTSEVEKFGHARVTDRANCKGPVGVIVTGSATVIVGGQMATRKGERSMHGGEIIPPCSPTKLIGGPSAGAVVGDIEGGKQDCKNISAKGPGGRESGSTQQSYSNCGLESARQFINSASETPLSEDELLEQAVLNDMASLDPDTLGGTSIESIASVLDENGVDTAMSPGEWENVLQAVCDGWGVITAHEVSDLYESVDDGRHALRVIGIKFDETGAAKTVFTNDTGVASGNCGRSVPAGQFASSLVKDHSMVLINPPGR